MQPCSHETKVIPQYCASMRVTGLYVICYLWAVCYLLLAACAAPSIKISTNCCLFSSSNTVLLQGKKAIRLSTTGWIIYWLWFMYFTTTSSSSLEIQLPILRYLVPSGTKKSRHSHNEFSQLFPRLADTWHVSWSWHRCSDCWHLNHHGSHKDGIVLLAPLINYRSSTFNNEEFMTEKKCLVTKAAVNPLVQILSLFSYCLCSMRVGGWRVNREERSVEVEWLQVQQGYPDPRWYLSWTLSMDMLFRVWRSN